MENEDTNFGLPVILREGLEEVEYNHRVKYRNLYLRLIKKGLEMAPEELSGVYCERHHILPRCLGGKDGKENYVVFPVRYHILAHLILLEVYPGHPGVSYAAHCMVNGATKERTVSIQKHFSTRTIARAKEKAHKGMSGKNNPGYGKPGPTRGMKLNLSKEVLEKKRNFMLGNNNPSSQRVIDPNGKVFESIKEASVKSGIPYTTLTKWLSGATINNHGWSYEGGIKRVWKNRNLDSNSKKVCGPNGEIYGSIKDACESNNIAYTTMRYWLSGRTKKNPGWSYYTKQESD